MAEAFTPITTQEDFDAAVADRLAPYADYDTLKSQNAAYAQQVNELNGKVKDYETRTLRSRIAHEEGIPYELAQRLTGSTEADIRKDAQSFAKMLKPKTPAPPLRSDPDDRASGKKAALRTFANQLMSKGE